MRIYYKFDATNGQIKGDINKNGSLDAADALLILKMAAGSKEVYGYTADYDESGSVDAIDALAALKAAAGK